MDSVAAPFPLFNPFLEPNRAEFIAPNTSQTSNATTSNIAELHKALPNDGKSGNSPDIVDAILYTSLLLDSFSGMQYGRATQFG